MKRSMPNVTLPIRKRRATKTVSWSTPLKFVRFIPSRHGRPMCYCHTCKYEVLCEAWDLPEGCAPVEFVPQQDEDLMCYCHTCKYDVLCEPCDLPSDASGPIIFIPKDEDIDIF
jgi:hypothetical protein